MLGISIANFFDQRVKQGRDPFFLGAKKLTVIDLLGVRDVEKR